MDKQYIAFCYKKIINDVGLVLGHHHSEHHAPNKYITFVLQKSFISNNLLFIDALFMCSSLHFMLLDVYKTFIPVSMYIALETSHHFTENIKIAIY